MVTITGYDQNNSTGLNTEYEPGSFRGPKINALVAKQQTHGTLSYTPPTDFVGIDTFEYTVCSLTTAEINSGLTVNTVDLNNCGVGLVTINVEATNRPPQVRNLPVQEVSSITRQTAFSQSLFTANFQDTDLQRPETSLPATLESVTILSVPSKGSLSLADNPTQTLSVNTQISRESLDNLIYKANPGETGNDTFEWAASDGELLSTETSQTDQDGFGPRATVTLALSAIPPIAAPDTFEVSENSVDNELNVLANDADEKDLATTTPGERRSLYLKSATSSPNGTAEVIETTVSTGTNDTYSPPNQDQAVLPGRQQTYGLLSYTPNPNFFGEDTLEYTVCGLSQNEIDQGITVENAPGELCTTGQVTVTVTAVNRPPQVRDLPPQAIDEETGTVRFSRELFLENFQDQDNDRNGSTFPQTLQGIVLVRAPSKGVLTVTNQNEPIQPISLAVFEESLRTLDTGDTVDVVELDTVTYTPNPGATGEDGFSWAAVDGETSSENAIGEDNGFGQVSEVTITLANTEAEPNPNTSNDSSANEPDDSETVTKNKDRPNSLIRTGGGDLFEKKL